MSQLVIVATPIELRLASTWLEHEAAAAGVPRRQIERLAICLNELLANVMDHGGLAADDARVRLHLAADTAVLEGRATLRMVDGGVPFDPTSSLPRVAAPTLADTEPGGLGLVMLRQNADALRYRREDGHNHLEIEVQWSIGDSVGWVPLFKGVEPDALSAALEDCKVRHLVDGEILLDPGSPNQQVYLLLAGTMEAQVDSRANVAEAITLVPGECLGEISVLDGKAVTALVVATSPCTVLVLSAATFWHRLMVLNGVAGNLALSLAGRARDSIAMALKYQRQQLELQHLRKELAVARRLQLSMLPPLGVRLFAARTDIDVCGFMEPASEVGGDLFDALLLDDDLMFLCIGDVSGHGIAAALFMAEVVSLLRIMALQFRGKPDRLLAALNERLCEGNTADIYVTLLCGYYQPSSGRFDYSNAGHCAPLRVAAACCTPLLVPRGALLGAMPGMAYQHSEVILETGDGMVFYTDGITEAGDAAQNEFGERQLESLLVSLAGQPASVQGAMLLDSVRTHCGNRDPDDDRTLLILQRC